ncbi:MAG: transposase [Vicinamibacteria bacterium]|nr:transposase [Vicinamibacteria bacterium]
MRAAWIDGRRVRVAEDLRLSRLLARSAGHIVDVDVEFARGPRRVGCRVVALPGHEAAMTRLCTNLARTAFSTNVVARLYRFRWQVELCFKEWKSYANLHQFATANAHIAAGLIWASLCAAVLKRFLAHAAQRVGRGTPMSTRRVAMCAHHMLDDLVAALLVGVGGAERTPAGPPLPPRQCSAIQSASRSPERSFARGIAAEDRLSDHL